MCLVGGGGGTPTVPPVTGGTSLKLNDPEILVEELLDTVIEPLLPRWNALAFQAGSVGDCRLPVAPSVWDPGWALGTS
jgi:hypothetical protein